MNKPNFFIIGAPKCGTTALSEYLRFHPDIFVCDPKEPHYFADDFPNHRLTKTLAEYIHLFDNAQNCQVIGEASVWYLYSELALKNIYQFDPEAKIIVMLRNPVDMVASFHSQAIYGCNENELDLERAWDLQWSRQRGENLIRSCREPKVLQYAKIVKFGSQMERLLTIFPKEQIHIILYEDFAKRTQQVYENVLAFLKVATDGRTNFERINANKSHRFGWLGKISEKPPEQLVAIAMQTKKLLGLERLFLIENLRKINNRVKPRKPVSHELRLKMQAEFEEDIDKLSQILDRDLSHWVI